MLSKNLTTKYILALSLIILSSLCCSISNNNDFISEVPENITRIWLGPEYWTNPLQDWQLNEGRIECLTSGGDRNVYLLSHELTDRPGTVKMSVIFGKLGNYNETLNEGWVGFKIGVRGEFKDYRNSAVRGDGFRLGLTTDGVLFIGKLETSAKKIEAPLQNLRLDFSAQPEGEKYQVTLSCFDVKNKLLSQVSNGDIDKDWLYGGVALVCNNGKIVDMPDTRPEVIFGNWGSKPGTARGGNLKFWFKEWELSGSKVKHYPDHCFGPVLFTQYTLSKGIMKMTAQMPPIGDLDVQTVQLEIKNVSWEKISEADIDPLSRTATFRIENWDSSKDTAYRVVYQTSCKGNKKKTHYYVGTIRKEPWDKEELVIAGFTGNNDLGFPNVDIFKNVKYHNPDVLFFSGDQIYEGVAGFGTQRQPLEKACLDYLRKWYLYGWAYGDLMRDRPTVAIPDDHDVYHGNIWGAGGIATPKGLQGAAAQDQGGYKMLPEWVNMVQRTQTSHFPYPYDATPVEQNIGVYYSEMNYGGISFAILEDRKFKSAPKLLLPKAKVHNGWAQNRKFDAKKEADVKGALLLGERQLKFLKDWAIDWSNKTWMKVALSQTIFANVATLPKKDSFHDRIVPQLRILNADEYPPDDIPVSDMDSNGWPQKGRNRALQELRRGFAFHLAGDQHLGSAIQYGINNWNDAGFAFCVPAISNVWPRRWYPSVAGKNREPNSPKYTGDFEDGFGNKMTVFAVSNPVFTGLKPSRLYDRATGYGIVRLKRNIRDITIECWPRLSDPSQQDAKQYPGWPITINQMDNYNRKAVEYLPTIKVNGMVDPVIQITNEENDEIIYTLRIKGQSYRPKVFIHGKYTVKVGEPGTNKEKVLKSILSIPEEQDKEIQINL